MSSDFADKMFVGALLSDYHGRLTTENWSEIENEIIGIVIDILRVDENKAQKIVRNGMIQLLTSADNK